MNNKLLTQPRTAKGKVYTTYKILTALKRCFPSHSCQGILITAHSAGICVPFPVMEPTIWMMVIYKPNQKSWCSQVLRVEMLIHGHHAKVIAASSI